MDIASSPPPFFRRGLRPLTKLMICAVLSIACLIADGRLGLLVPLRDTLSLLLYPLQWVVNTPTGLIRQGSEFMVKQSELQAENRALREHALILSARLQRHEELAQENRQLRALHQLAQAREGEARLAEVLYTGRDPFSHKIVIDKGSQDSIESGFPVVDDRGLIGQITRVSPLTSEVTLIIEKNHSVPVMVQRNGLRTVLFGTGNGIELRFVSGSADIRAGDLLVTSGIDGVYPAGLDVARVSSVERHAGNPFSIVRCTPIGAVDSRRFALVLTEKIELPPRPEEAAQTTPATPAKKGKP